MSFIRQFFARFAATVLYFDSSFICFFLKDYPKSLDRLKSKISYKFSNKIFNFSIEENYLMYKI